MNFSTTANVKYTVEQGRLYETHGAYRLALIHSTCSSNRQSELKVTHENTPTALPRFKNVIFRHHYVMQISSSCIETEQSYLCRVLHFNHQNLMLISLPNDQATGSLWHLLKISHRTLNNSVRCAKKRFCMILATAIIGMSTPEICFLRGQLMRTILPNKRYSDSLSVGE